MFLCVYWSPKPKKLKVGDYCTGALGLKPPLKIKQNKWLTTNHLYLQFALLFIGINCRGLFINADRLIFGLFLLATILAAITTVYLYGGRSWCHYICPFAVVQTVFTGPRGLWDSIAHTAPPKTITQSTCRVVSLPQQSTSGQGKRLTSNRKDVGHQGAMDKLNCVGCKAACFDIDAEKAYWSELDKPGRKLAHYGYLGIVVGYILYYFLYSGSWDYYFSGIWTHESNQLASIFKPGFYVFGHAIILPKLLASPMVIGLFVLAFYSLGTNLEKHYTSYLHKTLGNQAKPIAIHRLFSITTFLAFNIFFIYGGRPEIRRLPLAGQFVLESLVVLVSSLWLYRTWNRTQEIYTREGLADKLRRQLKKLTIDFSRFLEGRTMESLKPDEVYVLAKVLPGFNQHQGIQVYKGVLREALEQGNVSSSTSLEVLKQIRQGLGIPKKEHFKILTELGIEDPNLLDPHQQRTQENQLRLKSYQQALEGQLLELVVSGIAPEQALKIRNRNIQALNQKYGISPEEEAQAFNQIYGEDSTLLRRSKFLVGQLSHLADQEKVLQSPAALAIGPIFELIQRIGVYQRQKAITQQLLNILEILGTNSDVLKIAQSIRSLASPVLREIKGDPRQEMLWSAHLPVELTNILTPEPESRNSVFTLDSPTPWDFATSTVNLANFPDFQTQVAEVLKYFLEDLDPLIKAASLYALGQVNLIQARHWAQERIGQPFADNWLVEETAHQILKGNPLTYKEVLTLTVQISGRRPQELHFQQPVVRIGSDPLNEIVLNRPEIATQHAMLYLDDQGVSVIDLGSSNGLRVSDRRLKNDRQLLKPGDEISFGNYSEPNLKVTWHKQLVLQPISSNTLSTVDKLLILFKNSFFGAIQLVDLLELARYSSVRVHYKGEQIYTVGDVSNEILLLFQGTADVCIDKGGQSVKINQISTGETIGELGVLTRERRSATVIATATCYLLVIKAEVFESVLRQSHDFSRNLTLLLSQRIQRMTRITSV
jgi:hypothetical protein